MLRQQFKLGVFFARFVWKRLRTEACFEIAGALSYTTVFALVPLTATVFSVLAVFPGFDEWRAVLTSFIFENFVPGAARSVQQYLTEFADNATRTTAFGLVLLFFNALLLMASIEDAYNRIWRIESPRRGFARVSMYLTALIFGPLAVIALLAVSSYLFALPFLHHADEQYGFSLHILPLLPFLITWIALSASYALIPNLNQPRSHALWGGLLATLLFEVSKYGFTWYLGNVASYQQVYGALAAVPIFLGWVYLSWLVLLLGASFSASLSAFDHSKPEPFSFKERS